MSSTIGVDWEDYCQSIQDQGNCGSCTAFGTSGVAEANFKIKLHLVVKMSETDLFACSGGYCQLGNYVEPVLDKLVKGVASLECRPYVDVDTVCGIGRCNNWWETGSRIESWKSIRTIDEMKEALKNGPLVGVMDVHQSFMNYISGVYHSLGTSDPILGGHCIGIIGYSDELGAWKCRNSWGIGWGMNGYFWIKYGDSGIDGEMWSVVPSDKKPDPEEPGPSPCIVGNTTAKIMNFLPWLLNRKGRFFYRNP
jgi:hypothetical protein